MKTSNNQQPPPETVLRFSPYAWAKLLFMRDFSENEIGAFGITHPCDLLMVLDIVIVKQTVSIATVSFDDLAVANFFEQQVDFGRKPEQFARIWLHTHPGNSANPSMTDANTFQRVFGSCDWSVMCIVAQGGNTFARLHFGVGPGGDVKIPVQVDYSQEFAGSDFKAWKAEYKQNVKQDILIIAPKQVIPSLGHESPALLADDPMEQQAFMDDPALYSGFWDKEMGAYYE